MKVAASWSLNYKYSYHLNTLSLFYICTSSLVNQPHDMNIVHRTRALINKETENREQASVTIHNIRILHGDSLEMKRMTKFKQKKGKEVKYKAKHLRELN